MTRLMSPEREKEYEDLSAFINYVVTATMGIPASDPSHPANARIAERYGRSQALQSVKQAANDTVASLRTRPLADILRLDQGLKDAGLMTFSETSRRYGRTFQRILKRASIATETERYLVAELLADVTAPASATERAELERLVAKFESRLPG